MLLWPIESPCCSKCIAILAMRITVSSCPGLLHWNSHNYLRTRFCSYMAVNDRGSYFYYGVSNSDGLHFPSASPWEDEDSASAIGQI
jgi:hypothetical protein